MGGRQNQVFFLFLGANPIVQFTWYVTFSEKSSNKKSQETREKEEKATELDEAREEGETTERDLR